LHLDDIHVARLILKLQKLWRFGVILRSTTQAATPLQKIQSRGYS
jgi:hypothetical protein